MVDQWIEWAVLQQEAFDSVDLRTNIECSDCRLWTLRDMVPFPLHLCDPKDLANDCIRVRKSLDSLDGQKAIAEAVRTSHKYRLR